MTFGSRSTARDVDGRAEAEPLVQLSHLLDVRAEAFLVDARLCRSSSRCDARQQRDVPARDAAAHRLAHLGLPLG